MRNYWTTKKTVLAATLGAAVSFAGSASAAFDLAETPLFVSGAVDPNVVFLLDDSGSMQWEHMPDSTQRTIEDNERVNFMFPRVNNVYAGGNSSALAGCERDDGADYENNPPKFDANNKYAAFFRSPENNAVYYNPGTTYVPWKRADGTDFPDAVETAAFHNPFNTALGSRNLTTDLTERARWIDNDGVERCQDHTYYPATYFRYTGPENGNRYATGLYTRVEIKSGNAPFSGEGRANRSDCSAGVCTYAQEIQNFANWYTFYRSRILASRAGLSLAMANQPTSMRVGFGAINKGSTSVDGVNTRAVINGVRPFEGADKDDWFEDLFEHEIRRNNTPLRQALDGMGKYYQRTDNRGPWGRTPGTNDTTAHLECRPSFGILMTDGFWNGNSPGVGNQDDANGPSHTDPDGNTGQYTAAEPFRDGRSNTVADVAMKYYKEDLRPNLANRVRATDRDPAFWQHMVTYGVGFGVTGNVDPVTAFAAIETGTDIDWGDPTVVGPGKIDDLLHAGVNGHGGFFSAGDPQAFAREFDRIIADIIARTRSTTSVAIASSRLNTESLVYEGAFDSSDWSGNMVALRRNGTVEWNMADILNARTSERDIFSITSGGGVEFKPGQLDASQEAAMATTIGNIFTPAQLGKTPAAAVGDVINYIRGDHALERPVGPYRSRDSIMGDIVNSAPNFSGARNEGWSLLPTSDGGGREGSGSYGDYVDNVKASRPRSILVGSNGGMLHVINAGPRTSGGGEELFAYVPGSLLDELPNLANPEYGHQFFVDAEVRIADARLGGSWTTVAIGGLGGGGRGLYALDVSDPENFSTADVLWELDETDDADLGHIYFQPAVTRLSDGTWVAIFGNGINSGDEDGVLFVVNLQTGTIIRKIETGVGNAANPGSLGGPRFLMNTDDGLSVEFVYAGDLQGNMWKFDLSASNSAQWDSYFTQGNNPAPLFTAEDRSGKVQSIVESPSLARAPDGDLFVYFGTGRYFSRDDNSVTAASPIETFYAVRDLSEAPNQSGTFRLDRSDLTTIEITGEVTDAGARVRQLNESGTLQEDGFFIDLEIDNQPGGEKVLSTPRIQFGFLLFTTFETSEDDCRPGGTPRLYVLNAFTGGGQLTTSSIDCDDCGSIEILSGVDGEGGVPIDVPVVVDEGDTDPDPNDPPDPCTAGGTAACPWGKRPVEFVLPRSNSDGGSGTQCLQTRTLGCIKDGRVNWGQHRN